MGITLERIYKIGRTLLLSTLVGQVLSPVLPAFAETQLTTSRSTDAQDLSTLNDHQQALLKEKLQPMCRVIGLNQVQHEDSQQVFAAVVHSGRMGIVTGVVSDHLESLKEISESFQKDETIFTVFALNDKAAVTLMQFAQSVVSTNPNALDGSLDEFMKEFLQQDSYDARNYLCITRGEKVETQSTAFTSKDTNEVLIATESTTIISLTDVSGSKEALTPGVSIVLSENGQLIVKTQTLLQSAQSVVSFLQKGQVGFNKDSLVGLHVFSGVSEADVVSAIQAYVTQFGKYPSLQEIMNALQESPVQMNVLTAGANTTTEIVNAMQNIIPVLPKTVDELSILLSENGVVTDEDKKLAEKLSPILMAGVLPGDQYIQALIQHLSERIGSDDTETHCKAPGQALREFEDALAKGSFRLMKRTTFSSLVGSGVETIFVAIEHHGRELLLVLTPPELVGTLGKYWPSMYTIMRDPKGAVPLMPETQEFNDALGKVQRYTGLKPTDGNGCLDDPNLVPVPAYDEEKDVQPSVEQMHQVVPASGFATLLLLGLAGSTLMAVGTRRKQVTN